MHIVLSVLQCPFTQSVHVIGGSSLCPLEMLHMRGLLELEG